ncbi:hypothetical protein PENSTE_c011G00548 [Penicillium steckii]|uniref:Uncharacterized protein n=1 Tax=Penicillium steckii TaxID=303698 RepID=A0A1V6T6W3_9EURO|nr:hypothetical protein PENSTE_c011G00548 [Penicillium steckii]
MSQSHTGIAPRDMGFTTSASPSPGRQQSNIARTVNISSSWSIRWFFVFILHTEERRELEKSFHNEIIINGLTDQNNVADYSELWNMVILTKICANMQVPSAGLLLVIRSHLVQDAVIAVAA